jgi:hypothetical protein
MMLKVSVVSLFAVILLAACAPASSASPTPNVVVIRTSAAQTVVAEITLTAAAFTPTTQPTATEGAPATEPPVPDGTEPVVVEEAAATGTAILCDSLTYDIATVDVNIPDNSEMTPGQEFVKTWKVKNDGGCAWGAGYGLIYAGYGNRMSGQPEPMASVVLVGQEVEISISFKAPTQTGEYLSAWRMANDKGIPFGEVVYVKIVVK